MKTHNRSHAIGQHGGKLALLGLLAASAAVMSLLPTNKAQAHGYLMGDAKSRAIVDQMRIDEIEHGAAAQALGAVELPGPVRMLMRAAAKVMTTTAYYV